MKVGVSQYYFSMEWLLVKSLLWVLVLVVQIHEHRGCLEEENGSARIEGTSEIQYHAH